MASVGFVLFLCACITISGVYAVENCPNAKYPIEEPLSKNFKIVCAVKDEDNCFLVLQSTEHTLDAKFYFTAPEDISDVYYNVAIVGGNINAGSSGKAKTEIMTPDSAFVEVKTKLEGDISLEGPKAEGVATLKLYFNEQMKDTPDICVTTSFGLYNIYYYVQK